MAFGLLSTGLNPKTLLDIKAELEVAFRALFGASIPVGPTSNWGQLIGVQAERYAELWEVAQAIDAAFDPDRAEGTHLDALCALTGTLRHEASRSIATLIATGTNGTVLPEGRVVSVDVIGTRFATQAGVTLATASSWTISTAYGVGAVVKNGGNIYYCASAGVSAGSGGPTTEAFAITDGSVTWRFMGAGAAYAVVTAEAEETGPKIAAAGTLTTIETPVSGWTAVNNHDDADLGEDRETDAALRLRREDELLGNSRSTIDAIRTRIVEDVEDTFGVIVFQNDTEATNVDGMPPHSVEVLVRGGDDQEITDAVFANVAAGITTYGNQTGTHTDVDNGGQEYEMKWSRPDELDIWVIANVKKDPNVFPADGATQILEAILAYGDTFPTGKDVHSAALKARCFAIPGVLDVPTLYIDTSAAPASEVSITLALRELAMFDSARITVNVSDATP